MRFFVILVVLLLALGCDTTEESHTTTALPKPPIEEPTDNPLREVPAELPPATCVLKRYTYPFRDGERVLDMHFNNGFADWATIETHGEARIQTLRWHYSNNRLDSVTNKPGTNGMVYRYNEAGRLIGIDGTGWYFSRKFTLNDAGQIIRQETLRNDSLLLAFDYTYDDAGRPLTARSYDGNLVALEEHAFEFDGGRNPFAKLTAFVNPTELLYGYPVGTFGENLQTVTTTYRSPSRWEINGAIKRPGEQLVRMVEYAYNEEGFPVYMISSKQRSELVQRLYYNCP